MGGPMVLDDTSRFAVAKAIGPWIAYTPETHKERAREVRTSLLVNPPLCWLAPARS